MDRQDGQIYVLLADEQPLFREAVRMILAGQPDLVVVAAVGDSDSAVEEARLHEPDVALISIALNGSGGFAAARAISQTVPQCRVLILAAEEELTTLVDSMEAGASGYLSKESPVADLVEAIRSVHLNGIIVPQKMLPALIRGLVKRRRDRDEAAARYAKLTTREREVLRLLVHGAGNESIGRALVISPQTARTHVQNILDKLRVHSRLEAVAFARQMAGEASLNPPSAVYDAARQEKDDVA
ncbi:MAG: response regulator transcription factor [Actinomycetota bacterium]|nr:response regulator transcription factor [Actinomycetota bacterium]